MVTQSRKHAVILLAGKNDFARALHALAYTLDLKDHGLEPRLFFDGAGTEWLETLLHEEDGLRPLFDRIQGEGLVDLACFTCSQAFKTADAAKALNVRLGEEGGHVSVGELALEGYEVLVV